MEPVSDASIELVVSDVNGTVNIAAHKGDVTVSDRTGTVTLVQGQESTRQEASDQADNSSAKGNKRRAAGKPATPAALPPPAAS